MTAWISRIKLTNFKAYQNAEFKFPQPNKNGGNLVLIGALNGHGKTTLLEALYLGLYGEKSIDVLKRAVSYKDKTPTDLLENALSFKAKDDWKQELHRLQQAGKPIYSHKESGVKIQILIDIDYIDSQNTKNTLTISRVWSFKYHDKKQDFVMQEKGYEPRFQLTQNGVSSWLENEEQFFEQFSACMPNYNHSRFFFFDGEKLKDIGNKDAFIVGGLNDLIGITLLDNEQEGKNGIKQALESRLDGILRNIKKNKKEQDEWQKKEQQAQKLRQTIGDKDKQLMDIQEQHQDLKNEQDNLSSALGSGDTKTTADLIKEKEEIGQLKNELENNIQAALKQLPLYLLPKTEFNAFCKNIKKEFERIKLEESRKRLEPKLSKFNENFFKEIEQQEYGDKIAQSIAAWDKEIKVAIKNAWHSLHYPLSENEAEYVRHNYLSEQNHQDIAVTIKDRQEKSLPQIQQTLQQTEQYDKRLVEIDEELNQAKIENRDELLRQLRKIEEEIKSNIHHQGGLDNEINRLKGELATLEAEVKTIKQNLMTDGDSETEKLQRLIDTIDLLRERLISQKQKDLQDNTLTVYQQISHDTRVKSVHIADKKIEFLDSNQQELADDNFSAGEKHLQLTALTSALSQTTGFIAPMVIDTPLARLDAGDDSDKGNQKRLLDYLASLPQQVILLATSSEIDRNKCQSMLCEKQVIKTYRVKSEDFENGRIATVSECAYF